MSCSMGDEIVVKIDRIGLAQGSGVGHLPDDTMVVVVGGSEYIGESLEAVVVSIEKFNLGTSVTAYPKSL